MAKSIFSILLIWKNNKDLLGAGLTGQKITEPKAKIIYSVLNCEKWYLNNDLLVFKTCKAIDFISISSFGWFSEDVFNARRERHHGQSKKQLSHTEKLKRNSFYDKLTEYLKKNEITKFTTNMKTVTLCQFYVSMNEIQTRKGLDS